jgi:oligoribonuclease NrnB/cAMP/cGMP phosphodiesterase (DHH superfamily)
MVIVVYHANCRDGQGALYAAQRFYAMCGHEVEYIPWNYGMGLPPRLHKEDGADDIVDLLDFSFAMSDMIALCSRFLKVTLLDHHESAINALTYFSHPHLEKVLDPGRSGASIAWSHYFPNEPMPKVLSYIEDHDLWRFRLPDSKVVREWMSLYSRNGHEPIEQMEDMLTNEYETVVREGLAVQKCNTSRIGALIRRRTRINLTNYTCGLLNVVTDISETGAAMLALYTELDFSLTYFDDFPANVRRFSMRSRNGSDVLVNRLAEAMGGGGHPHAAGFEASLFKTLHDTLRDFNQRVQSISRGDHV